MGTLVEEARNGFVYLQEEVSSIFTDVLASTDYESADTFLEHLITIFEKVAVKTCALKVRDDVAQKFIALKCETRFQTSNDLMKHLLQLHKEHHTKSPPEAANSDACNHATAKEHLHQRRRKSQPKRNFKHSWLESNDISKSSIHNGGSNRREMSVSSLEDSKVNCISDGDGIVYDLSQVKREVIDNTEDSTSAKTLAKEYKLLCQALQTPLSVSNALDHAFIKRNTDHLPSSRHNADDLPVTETCLKSLQPVTNLKWKGKSEAVHRYENKPNKPKELVCLGLGQVAKPYNPTTSMEPVPCTQTYQIIQDEYFMDDDCNSYNYVLSSGDNSPSSENHSHCTNPESKMQSSGKYQKSISYDLVSDEVAEDLSFNNEKPQNSFIAKTNDLKDEKPELSIKYDRNGNTIAIPITKLPNGQFAQAHITVPHNLIIHENKSLVSNHLMGEPQVLHISQASKSVTVAQSGTRMLSPAIPGNQSVMFATDQTPQLQLINIHGPPSSLSNSQLFVQSGIVPQDVKYSLVGPPPPLLVASSAVSASIMSTDQTTSLISMEIEDDLMVNNHAYKKRRKQMQDTTVFRDPPEESLSFNGPNKFRFFCDVCDTGFTRRYTFNRHKCKGKVEKHYCQLCDKAYLSKYKLKDHILVKHEGQTVSCPECGKQFSSRSSMEMHKKQQHEGQYSIFCKICGKGFNHTGHYYGHMNKHTNTKPFWCQQCGKRFYGSSYLHNHKQVCRGSNELNFSCSACDRKFKCELYLKKHMKVHDFLPIINNSSIVKPTDTDLTKAGISVVADKLDADEDNSSNMPEELSQERNQPVFPNGADKFSDSSLNSGKLIIDESKILQENAAKNI